MSTPLATVKERFENKAKLIEAVEQFMSDELWVAHLSTDRGGNKGLKHVSNAKLLKLHAIFTKAKAEFGSRAKLIDAILELEGRSKDEGYRNRLERYAIPRLYDQYATTQRRVKRKSAKS
jgi:hypothetical protein